MVLGRGGGESEDRPLVKIICGMVDRYYFVFVATLTTLTVTENNSIECCDQSDNGFEGIWKEDVVIQFKALSLSNLRHYLYAGRTE
jgi:hypothetical protein